MLTGVQVVFIGGDARQLEIIHKLTELDASVTIVGYDQLQNPYHGVQRQPLSIELLKHADALVLPAVGTDDSGKVHAIFTSDELLLTEEHIAALPDQCVIFTGMAKPYLSKLCAKYRISLIELFDRDDVAIYNSIPTAEGAIMMAIQNTDITLHGSESVVLGMGRTGFTLARTLLGLGANVRIGVRRDEHFARAVEMGFKPFFIADLARQVSNIDLLFNTIPTMIVTAQVIAQIPNRAVIIDLASFPGGVDFRFAEKRGIKAMLAPGLPGIVAPKSAGRILAQSITQLLLEDMRNRGSGQ
ncbi:dipicolinate synthase subunit DpsA [Paenibacillus alvei]|uniref:Dipicolinate synthase subunit DpsA n=2 Tax=Paenibacillus TaxID=44249 RepID=A0AAP7DHU0_PAEAL|nr:MULTISPECIES: dipicolinate synthase subunit DpsA [Paenibacillus]EJW15548.1 dipicolinate synthase, A chain [Paenibacillus alvei DSM 29]MBG9733220.1 dipicolinate synthase subunit A [Paenibacillus alvei]MBG9745220.1 dipicolinate synthase subunit A [Paenibacillus alvei]MCY9542539.1 dipicolinate synthase subunit DpsA [Paenibacillus alvei]MCY9580636.1 dipicolinate synthase subunit DpsA [Paenibacillus alvei]